MTPAIRIQSVTKRFGPLVAVSDVSLEVPEGTFLGLLGRNGAGKSTLIKMITGLMKPTQGEIHVLGEKVSMTSLDIKRRIGVTPQRMAMIDGLTGAQYLRLIGRLYGLVDDVIEPREPRVKLIKAFEMLRNKRDTLPAKKHGNIPL